MSDDAKCTRCGMCCNDDICKGGKTVLESNGLGGITIASQLMKMASEGGSRCPFLMLRKVHPDDESSPLSCANCVMHYYLYNTAPTQERKNISEPFFLARSTCVLKRTAHMQLQNEKTGEINIVNLYGENKHVLRCVVATGRLNADAIEKYMNNEAFVDAIGGKEMAEKLLAFTKEVKEANKEEGE